MNTKQFSEALSNVNDKYINEAIGDAEASGTETVKLSKAEVKAAEVSPDPRKMRRSIKVWRAIAIAACAVLVAGVGFIGIIAAVESGSGKSASYRDSDAYYSYDSYNYDSYSDGYAPAGSVMDEEAAYESEGYYAPEAKDASGAYTEPANTPSPQEGMKIIYSAYLYMETTQFDDAANKIEELADQTGAYFESASISANSVNYRTASYIVRVPVEKLDTFLDEAQKIGTVTSLRKNADDVTESYYDIETRLDTAKAKLARLQELLATATSVDDMIIIESEISDTQYVIDSLTGTLNHYDSRISYSTVSIDLKEVYKITEENAPLTFGQRIAKAFRESLSGFGNFLEGFVFFLARCWIWILIAAVIAVVVIVIIRNKRKHTK